MQGIIKFDDSKYPELLKKISDPPKQLYYRGNWPADGEAGIFENCLAVVGSRRMTSYGKQITNKLVSEIAGRGITIVSGFMYGIDAEAHKTALDIGGRTVAVMPCGIERIHPEYQTKLYADILENNGLIISEYEGEFLPTLWTYPRRNRIVAGLSKAVMVVEAGLKSGSLITANLAKKYKRKVFAVPGPLTSVLSQGICQLIKEGADVVTCAGDVLEYYNVGAIQESPENTRTIDERAIHELPLQNLSSIEQQIIQKLQQEPMEIDGLSRLLKISSAEIGTAMSLMQLKDLIFIENGKYYAR